MLKDVCMWMLIAGEEVVEERERERVKEEELGTGDLKNLEDRSGGCGEGEKEGTGKKRVATRRAKNIIISSP